MNLIKKHPSQASHIFFKKEEALRHRLIFTKLDKESRQEIKKKERKHEGELDKFSASGKVAPSFTLPQSSSPRESQHDKSICLESSSGY
jgi:GTP-binding protein EngB required for normal cell division